MFELQTIVIESGEGRNHFKAEVSLDTIASPQQTQLIMENLRQMQKDRMQWASANPANSKQVGGQGPGSQSPHEEKRR